MSANEVNHFIPTEFPPTTEQIAIQTSHAKTVIVEANAGAAKTTTLALRVAEALWREVPPDKILALVFTSEAKKVFKDRLQQIGIPYARSSKVLVETIDGFASKILARLDDDIPEKIDALNDLKPRVINAIDKAYADYGRNYEDLEFLTHNEAISQFVNKQLILKASMSLSGDFEGMSNEDIAFNQNISLTHWLMFLSYERLRLDGAMWRGPFDATYDLARKLDEFPELRSQLPFYRLLVCDEMHDLGEAAYRILTALLANGETYFCGAGDKDQVIYSTLGANAQYLQKKFETDFPNLKRLPLTATFRYGPHLALAVGELMEKHSTSPLKLITEINCKTYAANNFQQCADLAVDSIIEWKKGAKGKCAILIRDRHQSVYIENALIKADIDYELVSLKSYLKRDEVLFLRGMLAIALRNLEAVNSFEIRKTIVEALFVFGEVEIKTEPDSEYFSNPLEYAKEVIANDPFVLNTFYKAQILKRELGTTRRIQDAVEFIEGLPDTARANDALRGVCKILDMKSLVRRVNVDPYEASVVERSIQGFIDTAKRSGKNIREFSQWLSQMEDNLSRNKKNPVMLECIPSAKGMEFDHVVMPFLEIGQFPDQTASAKEEENLFYVGITRAKNALTLLTPSEPRLQSPYIKRMAIESVKAAANACVEKAVPLPMRTVLNVPYSSKDKVKSLGAKWDNVHLVWYVAPEIDLKPFDRWIQRGHEDSD